MNQQWVFRFPKRADVDEQLVIESRILSALAAQSPLPLPVFSFQGQPSEAFPHSFVEYRKIPGVPCIQVDPAALPPATWAPALGRFLSWLHEFPVAEAARLGVPRRDVEELIEEVRADALDDFGLLKDVTEAAPLEQWRAFLEAGCPRGAGPHLPAVLVHHDLAAEHVLCDPARQEVTGIIDWSEIAIGDRSVDLAGFLHWGGPSCLEALLSGYEARSTRVYGSGPGFWLPAGESPL